MSYLIKFGDKKWIKKLQSGEIFMQPIKYYRDLEKKQMKKGQGDKHDGMLYSTMPGGTIRLIGNDKNSPILSVALDYENDENNLIACFYDVDSARLKIGKPTQLNYNLIEFTKGEKREFAEWGDTALIIDKEKFIDRLNLHLVPNKITGIYNKVEYYNPNDIHKDCIRAYTEKLKSRFLWKEDFFINQNEFRIVLDQMSESGKVVINIEDISDISICVDKKKLLNT